MGKRKRRNQRKPKNAFEYIRQLPDELIMTPEARAVFFEDKKAKQVDLLECLLDELWNSDVIVEGYNYKRQRVEKQDDEEELPLLPDNNSISDQPFSVSGGDSCGGEDSTSKPANSTPTTSYQDKKNTALKN